MAGRRRWPPNDRLVYERKRRAWSQEEAAGQADQLAIRLGLRGVVFTGAQFGRWERGECRPRPPYLGVVCQLYDVSAEALGLCDPPPPSDRSALASVRSAGTAVLSLSDMPAEGVRDLNRRAAMSSMAAVLGATLLEFTGALRHSNVGERMLAYIEADATRFATQYVTVSPSELLPPVQETVTVIQNYLDGHQPIEHRRRLCRAAAQLATVAGMTLFNLRNEQQARWAFRAAGEAAAEAEDNLLGAWVVASECMIPTYTDDPWGVLTLTQRGQRLADGPGSAVLAKLAALEAKAHASLGNDSAARDALASANRAMAMATAEELQPGVFGFTPAKYFFYEGTCHVRLGQPDAALAASEQALGLYQPTKAFNEPTIARIDMAMAYAKKGDLDHACQLTRQAAAIPAALRTGPIVARVQEFFAGLEPRHRSLPAIQEIREQLALPRPTQTDGA
jgi:transcriptional regulator with XRE-family HTH domain/tetratricopeptide (TPR) repeat protein